MQRWRDVNEGGFVVVWVALIIHRVAGFRRLSRSRAIASVGLNCDPDPGPYNTPDLCAGGDNDEFDIANDGYLFLQFWDLGDAHDASRLQRQAGQYELGCTGELFLRTRRRIAVVVQMDMNGSVTDDTVTSVREPG